MKVMAKGRETEPVEKYKPLDGMLTADGKRETEVKIIIAMAKGFFNKRKNLFCSCMNLEIRKCYVCCVLLYECETLRRERTAKSC